MTQTDALELSRDTALDDLKRPALDASVNLLDSDWNEQLKPVNDEGEEGNEEADVDGAGQEAGFNDEKYIQRPSAPDGLPHNLFVESSSGMSPQHQSYKI